MSATGPLVRPAAGDSRQAWILGTAFFAFSAVFWGMNVPMTTRMFATWDAYFLAPARLVIASTVLALLVLLTRGARELAWPIGPGRALLIALPMTLLVVSGEIDPALHGRHDLKAYYSGAALIDNLIVRKAGGLRKRQGTDIIADLSDYPGCRVIPFFFDRTNCSLIVLHSQTARFLDQQPDGTFAFARAADDEIYALAGMPWADADLASVRFSQLGDTVFQISTPTLTDAEVTEVREALNDDFGVQRADFSVNSIGPTFGAQVARTAVIAVIASLLLISIYMALRFERKFVVPVLIVYALLQKNIIKGLTAGAVKG